MYTTLTSLTRQLSVYFFWCENITKVCMSWTRLHFYRFQSRLYRQKVLVSVIDSLFGEGNTEQGLFLYMFCLFFCLFACLFELLSKILMNHNILLVSCFVLFVVVFVLLVFFCFFVCFLFGGGSSLLPRCISFKI